MSTLDSRIFSGKEIYDVFRVDPYAVGIYVLWAAQEALCAHCGKPLRLVDAINDNGRAVHGFCVVGTTLIQPSVRTDRHIEEMVEGE